MINGLRNFAWDSRWGNYFYYFLTEDHHAFSCILFDLAVLIVALDEVEDGSAQRQVREEQQQQGEPLLLGHSRILSAKCWSLADMMWSRTRGIIFKGWRFSCQIIRRFPLKRRTRRGYAFLTWFPGDEGWTVDGVSFLARSPQAH